MRKMLILTAGGLAVAIALLVPVRPAPDYTKDSSFPPDSWQFVVYPQDGSVQVVDYNLTLMDCLKQSESSKARSKGCERNR